MSVGPVVIWSVYFPDVIEYVLCDFMTMLTGRVVLRFDLF